MNLLPYCLPARPRLLITGSILLLLLLPISVTICSAGEDARDIRPGWSPTKFVFNGSPTGKDVFDSTGILVRGDGARKLIALTNFPFRYAVALPYSEKWVFHIEKGHLKGNAGPVNFDVQIWGGDETPDQHLTRLKNYLLSINKTSSARPDAIEISTYRSLAFLRNEVDVGEYAPALKGAKHVNFYSVRKRGDTLFKLHLSVVVDPDAPAAVEETYRQFATEGFVLLNEKLEAIPPPREKGTGVGP
jgi:hypothetical protein